MGKRKRVYSWVLSIAMLFSLVTVFPITVSAEDSYDASIYVVDGTGSGSGWTFAAGEIWINEDGSYLISGDGIKTSNRIRVKTGVTADVTLDNVNIEVNLPFEVGGTSNVKMILKDYSNNIFTGWGGHAGIRVQPSATLTITTEGQPLGNGMLTAIGGSDGASNWACAGIGGSEQESSGTIIINGGTILAKGGDGRPAGAWRGPGAAGIGGAMGSSCGDITINGGTVTAIGGNVNPEGAGIGGGSSDPSKFIGKITINGGTVRAFSGQSGLSGTGIGFCDTISISDSADVKAYSSGNYPAIYGNAGNENSAFLLNFMLDSVVLEDTDITINQKYNNEDTFELMLQNGYKNFATTVETSNNYNANLSDGSKKIVSLSDESFDFLGICNTTGTAILSVNVKLKAKPACMISEVEYDTLDEALAAASVNEETTIILLKDISYTNTISANTRTISIDLNGNDLNVIGTSAQMLKATNGGVLNIYDVNEKGGSLTVNVSGADSFCAHASAGGKINITGTLTASYPGSGDNQGIIALYAYGNTSSINLTGNATGYSAGALAQDHSTITVIGDVVGSYYGVYAAYNGLVNITGNVTATTNGLAVEYGGLAVINGNIKGETGVYINNTDSWNAPTANINGNIISTGHYAINVSRDADIDVYGNVTGQVVMSDTSNSSKIEIMGDVFFANGSAIAHESGIMIVNGDVTSPNGWGVFSNSTFTLNGNIIAREGVHSYAPSGNITINGNITADNSFGVYIYNGATVTVNGTIKDASPYIRLDYVDYTQGSGIKEDIYMKYSTYTNNNPTYIHTVYVLLPQLSCVIEGCDTTLEDGGFSEYTEIDGKIYYHISTAKQLAHISKHLDLNYIQISDINLSEYNSGNWIPIGTNTKPFSGSFDGSNFTIEGLSINKDDYHYTVLFGYSNGATFKNINIKSTVEPPSGGGNGNGGGGSGSSATISYFYITASAGNGGTISPSGTMSIQKNQSTTYTITPMSGYIIEDVIVDGVSVGAVKKYTFTNITENHRIQAMFEYPSRRFIDVNNNLWYREGIDYVLLNGLFKGTSETTFEPNINMTRAMLVTVLWRLENEPNTTITNLFTDINNDAWFTKAVAWATKNNIVKGYDANKFGPNDPITREQLAAILYRYASYKKCDITKANDISSFSDSRNISDWALSVIKWAVAEELIKGVNTTKLDPTGYATRAQVASILMRFIENIIK